MMNENFGKHFGYIDRFYPDRGFGFLMGEDGMSYFFHYSGLKFAVANVMVGNAVTFEVVESMVKGKPKTKAINITLCEGSESIVGNAPIR